MIAFRVGMTLIHDGSIPRLVVVERLWRDFAVVGSGTQKIRPDGYQVGGYNVLRWREATPEEIAADEQRRLREVQAQRAPVLPSPPTPEDDMATRGRKGHNPGGKPARIEIKAPPAEKEAAEAKAHAAGLTLSEWTRQLWREAPDPADLADVDAYAAAEGTTTGETVTRQSVLRRAMRLGLEVLWARLGGRRS